MDVSLVDKGTDLEGGGGVTRMLGGLQGHKGIWVERLGELWSSVQNTITSWENVHPTFLEGDMVSQVPYFI